MTAIENSEAKNGGEKLEALAFEDYRELCDAYSSIAFRKVGLVDEQNYRLIHNDPSTVWANIHNKKVPLFVDIRRAGGYDGGRTIELTEAQNGYLLTCPPALIRDSGINLGEAVKRLDGAIIVETDSAASAEEKKWLTEELSSGAEVWEAYDFIDKRLLQNPENVNANMSIYEARYVARDNEGLIVPRNHKTFKQVFEEEKKENLSGENDVRLIEAHDLRNNPELFDQLWALCDEKFEWLGDFHPVSMQETKDFFSSIVFSDSTHTLVRSKKNDKGDDEAVCAGFFMDGTDGLGWLHPKYIEKVLSETHKNHEEVQYFYGIVSKSNPEKQLGYAEELIRAYSRLVRRLGGEYRLIFESTNMSSMYIPRLVKEYSAREAKGMRIDGDIKKAGTLDYWFIKPKN